MLKIQTYLFIPFSLLLLSCSIPQNTTNISLQEDLNTFQKSIVEKHNQLRQLYFNDSPLQYSMELEEKAQNHANYLVQNGEFKHDQNNRRNNTGENLYAHSGSKTPDLPRIIQSWFDEKKYYHYESNHCQIGKLCGHYTQIIWKDSSYVGCAIAPYQRGRFKGGYVTSCKYSSPGNIMGQRPY